MILYISNTSIIQALQKIRQVKNTQEKIFKITPHLTTQK